MSTSNKASYTCMHTWFRVFSPCIVDLPYGIMWTHRQRVGTQLASNRPNGAPHWFPRKGRWRVMWQKSTLRSLEDITKHDRTQLRALPGLHNALAVALPLIIGLVTNHTLSGLGIAIGALVAAFAAVKGTLRKRLRTMLWVSVWMGVATFIGALSGGISWLTITLMVLIGFAAGILNAVSVTAGQIGMLTTNIFIIISHAPQSSIHALDSALLVMAGGFLQIVLMGISDGLSQSNAETTAVKAVYATIANYAQSRTRNTDLLVAASLLDADTCLNDSWLHKGRWEKLRVLVDLAELIRMDIVTSTRIRKGLQNHGALTDAEERGINTALTTITNLFRAAAKLPQMRKLIPQEISIFEEMLTELGSILREMAVTLHSNPESATYICLHQLHSKLAQVVDILSSETLHQAYAVAYAPRRSSPPKLRRMFLLIRTNLTFRSSSFRHAVRLAVALGIAATLYRGLNLPLGYWLPLTTVIVLRPDFFSTFSRGIARMLGTVLGVLLATLLTMIPDTSHLLDITLIILLAWALYTVVNFNFALFSFFLTSEIVILLSFFEHSAPSVAITARVTDTIFGSLLGLVLYLVWPTWQRQNVSTVIADWIHAVQPYFRTVIESAPHSSAKLQSYRKRARLARTNAVSVVEQFMLEPVNPTLNATAVAGIVAALHRFSNTLLSLESRVGVEQQFRANSAVVRWTHQMDEALTVIENSVRGTNLRLPAADFNPPIVDQKIVDVAPSALFTLGLLRLEESLENMVRMLPISGPQQIDLQTVSRSPASRS
ncbi:FUSC family protein [Alicyclobacillaceae bacterium I2511]|nr:FUSC family protein [Alicyclobacillaceae bacterium I2511]